MTWLAGIVYITKFAFWTPEQLTMPWFALLGSMIFGKAVFDIWRLRTKGD